MSLPQTIFNEYIEFFWEYRERLDCGQPVKTQELYNIYRKLLKIKTTQPTNADAYNSLGMAACLLVDKESCERYHKAALTLNPISNYYHNFASSMFFLEDAEKAMTNIKKAININPQEFKSHLLFLNILEISGKIDEAKRYVEELLEKNFPDNHTLISLYEDLIDYDQFEVAKTRARESKDSYISIEEAINHIEV